MRFSLLSSWQKTLWFAGRHDAREGSRFLHLDPKATRNELSVTLNIARAKENSKTTLKMKCFL